ncbi:MAG: ribbon-helix-helix domain-containing protein [Terrisporobacter sp.]
MLKNRTRIGSAIDTELYNKLKKLSDTTRIPISKLLDEAIENLLSKHNQQ